jgi:alginate O-acetyltransferase complex protein AlgI
MIYLDFSGLSDVAIGWGAAFGVKVPENFNRPYLQNNIQHFWQCWHMTLTRWLQAYIFMPLSRRLMRTGLRARPRIIMLVGYVVTFTACGLWHGESANFLVWGAFHGLGIFAYTALPTRWRAPAGDEPRWTLRGIAWWLGTLHFVCIGWVLFACPLPTAWTALGKMLIP